MIWLMIILVLLLCCYFRMLWQRYVSLRYQHKLYALRDRLRMLAIEGKVGLGDWVFQFLDSSISRAVHRVPKTTLWSEFPKALFSSRRAKAKTMHAHLDQSLHSNPHLQEIFEEFGRLLVISTFEKHRYSVLALIIPIGSTLLTSRSVKNKVRSSILDSRVTHNPTESGWAY